MSSTNSIYDPIKFVKLDFTEFDNICSIISNMCHSVNTWLQVNDIEVVTYLHICLEAYIVINQQNLRNRAGRYDPAIDFLPSLVHIFKLPTYFKSVIREMARPMYDQNGTIYIPDIPSICINSFVDNSKLMIRSQILKILGEDLNIPLSPIDIEPFMKPIPFGVYHENSNEILSFAKLPHYRTKAQNALRHIRFQQILPLQMLDGKYQALLEDEETVQIVDSLQDLNPFTNPRFGFYFRDKVGKVQINNIPMYRTLHGFYNIPQKLLVDDDINFPTEVPKAKKRKHSHHKNKKNRSSKDTGSSGFTLATATTPTSFISDAASRFTSDANSKYTLDSSLDSPQTGGESSSLNSIFNSSPIR